MRSSRPKKLYMAVEKTGTEWFPVIVGREMQAVLAPTQAKLEALMDGYGFSRSAWRMKEFRIVGSW
jgi:hypothetical protein